jgi:hypothetical protein
LILLVALAPALLMPPPLKVEITKVELSRRGAPDVEVTLPRDKWLDLRVTLVVPPAEKDIDGLEIMAENLMPGYWDHRQPPNLFVTIERLDAEGNPHAARARVLESGTGQNLREHFKDITIELLDTPGNREKRIREFIAQHVPPEQITTSVAAVVRGFDSRYIGNPPGKYRLEFEYRGAGGAFAHRTVLVQVNDGPDTLDDLVARP